MLRCMALMVTSSSVSAAPLLQASKKNSSTMLKLFMTQRQLFSSWTRSNLIWGCIDFSLNSHKYIPTLRQKNLSIFLCFIYCIGFFSALLPILSLRQLMRQQQLSLFYTLKGENYRYCDSCKSDNFSESCTHHG